MNRQENIDQWIKYIAYHNMNQMKYQEFVKNFNKQNLGKLNENLLEKLYKQYILKYDQSSVPRLSNKLRLQTENQGKLDHCPLLNYPFKSKIEHFKKLHGKSPDKIQDIPPDYQIKLLSRLSCPYFSPKLGSWEIGLVFSMDERIIRANQIYLFCININTKYLVVFPLRDISAGQIMNALQILVKYYHVTNIRGDGEKGFNGTILKSFCQEHKITSFFTDSKFTKHNRVVDSVIRTIRNAFVDDSQKFADNDLMQYIVKMYNQTPHSAYDNKYSPQQVNDNQDIEGQYIRQQQDKLFEIKQQQQSKGLLSFQPRNILMIHLDYSKTSYQFVKQRRNFNELAQFIKYSNGNVTAKLLKPYNDIKIIELPIQYCKLIANNILQLDEKYKQYFKI